MPDEIGTFQAAGRINVSRMTFGACQRLLGQLTVASKTMATASPKFVCLCDSRGSWDGGARPKR
jgi:hypothetical protein